MWSQLPPSPQQAPSTCFQNVFMFTSVQSPVSVLILYNNLNPLFSHHPFFSKCFLINTFYGPIHPLPLDCSSSLSRDIPSLTLRNRFKIQHLIKNFFLMIIHLTWHISLTTPQVYEILYGKLLPESQTFYFYFFEGRKEAGLLSINFSLSNVCMKRRK